MTKQKNQRWLIVASLFVTVFLVFGGGFDSFPIFLAPLLHHFHWSRARTSTLESALLIAAGVSAPIVGALLDRFEAKLVITFGALIAGLALLAASRVNSFAPMLIAYLVLGLGIGASTVLPVSLVIANWFESQRGLAMAIALSGTSLGGAVMALVANAASVHGGWRAGYVALGVPILVIAVPLTLFKIHTRPASHSAIIADAVKSIGGLDFPQGLSTRSFWMICVAQFVSSNVVAGTHTHIAAHLVDIGYDTSVAVEVISATYVATSIGKVIMGLVADRLGGRASLAINFALIGCGVLLIFGVQHTAMLILFVAVYGMAIGAPQVLIPMTLVESVGLKRFGSLAGLVGIFNTAGAALGPVATGRIFDLKGSYTMAFAGFAAMSVVGLFATLACEPLKGCVATSALPMEPVD